MRRAVASLAAISLVSLAVWAGASHASSGRGPGSIPPPTPVPPFGSPSPYPSVLATPEDPSRVPKIDAPSAVLLDMDSGDVLLSRAARDRRPIASLTKIMTAVLVLEAASLDEPVTVSPLAAAQGGASLDLIPGERIRVRHLLYALMLQSSNDVAVALAEHVAGSVEAFVELMNRRARRLGLRDTRFMSPSGLDDRGYSSALDMARLTAKAFRDPTLARVVRTRFHTIPGPDGAPRRVQSRNILLWLYPGTFGGKSGYTVAAGSCLVVAAERDDLSLVSVVLGDPSEAFTDSAALLDHGFATFERRRVVIGGERFEPVRIEGRVVAVEAVQSLKVLVRRDVEVARQVIVNQDTSLPVEEGTALGEVVVLVADREVGRVPLVAAEAVATPASAPRPWSRRVWDSAAAILAAMFRALIG